MRTTALLLIHLLALIGKLLRPGGCKAIVAENLMLRQQLIVMARTRNKAPNLKVSERVIFGWLPFFIAPQRVHKSAVILKPATILKFHRALVKRKYRHLFGSSCYGKPGPKEPSKALIRAIIEIKQRNPRFGCPRIALIIANVFGIEIDKDVVRRVLARYYAPDPDKGNGPSWLSFIGHMKDSLWSIDFFRCESINLKSHWVLVVMDQWSRRIVGFAVHRGPVDGSALCRLFNQAISGLDPPTCLSTDNDPLFRFHRWQANLRILGIEEIKTVPHVPLSHPFVERLIGTVRREYPDHTLFWNVIDLERKLNDFKAYYNNYRAHSSLGGQSPCQFGNETSKPKALLDHFSWKYHCRGLFQTPIAA